MENLISFIGLIVIVGPLGYWVYAEFINPYKPKYVGKYTCT